jgi:hypothetical protein
MRCFAGSLPRHTGCGAPSVWRPARQRHESRVPGLWTDDPTRHDHHRCTAGGHAASHGRAQLPGSCPEGVPAHACTPPHARPEGRRWDPDTISMSCDTICVVGTSVFFRLARKVHVHICLWLIADCLVGSLCLEPLLHILPLFLHVDWSCFLKYFLAECPSRLVDTYGVWPSR